MFYRLFPLYYLYRFESILRFQSSTAEMDKLSEEFIEFQQLHDENIPKQIWDQATVKVDTENDQFYHWMDIIWHYLSSLKAPHHTAPDHTGTLSSILTIKLAKDMPAHQFEPTKDLLKTAKSATWNYNKEHSNK